jgi:hypothetical protein
MATIRNVALKARKGVTRDSVVAAALAALALLVAGIRMRIG